MRYGYQYTTGSTHKKESNQSVDNNIVHHTIPPQKNTLVWVLCLLAKCHTANGIWGHLNKYINEGVLFPL